MPVNYALSKIYKIVDLTTNECYIGSTCEPTLARRLSGHVRSFRKYKAGKYRYVTSFKILEGENFRIELVEAFPCNNKDELRAREGYWIRSIDCVNKRIAGRTRKEFIKEYYENNKDKILQRVKEYTKNNKQTINTKRLKKCYCLCGTSYIARNKSLHYKTIKHRQFDTDYESFILSNNPSLYQLIDFINN
jgi:hypothetical protein